MVRGLILDSTGDRADSLKEMLDKMYKAADFNIIETAQESVNIIDTRNIDMVLVPMGKVPLGEVIESTESFVNNIIEPGKNFIRMKINNSMKYINIDRILCIEVMGRNSYIYTPKNKYTVHRQSLSRMLEQINDPYLIRCHKSYAVNIRNVTDIYKERRGIWKVAFKQKTKAECLVGEIYYDIVMRKHEEWLSIVGK